MELQIETKLTVKVGDSYVHERVALTWDQEDIDKVAGDEKHPADMAIAVIPDMQAIVDDGVFEGLENKLDLLKDS